MESGDFTGFAQALTLLAEVHDVVLSSERIAAYFEALLELPLESVRFAIQQAVRESRFFPKPVELRELAGAAGPDLGAAHAALLRAMRSPGSTLRQPPLAPLLALLVDRLGGWRAVMGLPADDLWHRLRTVYEPTRQAAAVRGNVSLALPDTSRRQLTALPGGKERAG